MDKSQLVGEKTPPLGELVNLTVPVGFTGLTEVSVTVALHEMVALVAIGEGEQVTTVLVETTPGVTVRPKLALDTS